MSSDFDADLRELAAQLFGGQRPADNEPAATTPPTEAGHHVPTEGGTVPADQRDDTEMREFVGELFGSDPNARNLHHDN